VSVGEGASSAMARRGCVGARSEVAESGAASPTPEGRGRGRREGGFGGLRGRQEARRRLPNAYPIFRPICCQICYEHLPPPPPPPPPPPLTPSQPLAPSTTFTVSATSQQPCPSQILPESRPYHPPAFFVCVSTVLASLMSSSERPRILTVCTFLLLARPHLQRVLVFATIPTPM